jgi:hypothetical protein
MQKEYTTFTVTDPKTKRKVQIPISNEDLLTKSQKEIEEIITAIIEATLNKKK